MVRFALGPILVGYVKAAIHMPYIIKPDRYGMIAVTAVGGTIIFFSTSTDPSLRI